MRRTYAVLGWLAAALAATGVGVAALGVLGDGIVGEAAPPMSPEQVRHALARATNGASATPSGTSGTPRPTGTSREGASGPVVLASAGGTVVARCLTDGTVLLDSWSPRQGYQVEDIERGPARHVKIQFESDDLEFKGRITCSGGRPVAHWTRDD